MHLTRKRALIVFLLICLPVIYFCETLSVTQRLAVENACMAPPAGMVCVPGGKGVIGRRVTDPAELKKGARHVNEAHDSETSHAVLGNDAGERVVELSPFYIDKYEVTNEDFDKCVKAGVCRQFHNFKHPLYNGFRGPKQPAVPASWEMAFTYCKWAGKRLPTEAEWEFTARGGAQGSTYSWGDDEPDCSKAYYRGCRKSGLDKTQDVGSYPAGHFGVYDMAGNGYEWVNDWASDCREGCAKACGTACTGRDPLGPCSGKYPCDGHTLKVLRGGSFWWPAEYMKGWSRRLEKIQSGGNRLSFRCASSTPYLTGAPGWMIKTPPADLPDPCPLTEPEQKLISSIENDVLDKPLCDQAAWSRPDCKDPLSYVMSNESQHYLFMPYIRNLGGAYFGVAAEANYSFIAHARSRYAFLMDYDINVVRLHRLIRALVKEAKSPKEFISLFEARNARKAEKLIRDEYRGDDKINRTVWVYNYYREKLQKHYLRIAQPSDTFKDFGWLRNPEAYRYVRLLYRQGRIAIVEGDLLKDKAMRSIGKTARELGTTLRIYYPSNAEEMWDRFPASYRLNVMGMPFDERSIALRTIWANTYPKGRKQRFWHGLTGGIYWHYVVHGALDYQKKIQFPDYSEVDAWKYERLPSRSNLLSVIRLPLDVPAEQGGWAKCERQ